MIKALHPWFDEMDAEKFFGREKVDMAKKIVRRFHDGEEMWEALEGLREKVREIFGLKISEEAKRWNPFFSVATRYLDLRGLTLIVNVLEDVDEDGVGYLAQYEVAEGAVRFVNIKLLIPSWWVE